jgi:heme/copper-type cytochrome/quinol oxidase subunit 3
MLSDGDVCTGSEQDSPWKSQDDARNEVEFENTNSVKKTWEEEEEENTVATERIVIVVLASLLFAVVMFGVVFLYYYRCRHMVKEFMDENDLSLPSLPALPKMPKLSKVTLPQSYFTKS